MKSLKSTLSSSSRTLKVLYVLLLFLFINTTKASSSELSEKKINLVWLCDPNGLWEGDWLHEVLSQVKYGFNEIVDKSYGTFVDNSIIVITSPNAKKYLNYFQKLNNLGYKFGIIHISDETYFHPTDFYPFAQFILRNYWHKSYSYKKNLFSFPLGYKNRFWKNCPVKELKDSFARRYTWSFAGQITKSTRRAMIGNMIRIPKYHIHQTSAFASADCLSIEEYRDLMLDSIFVPCPRGNWNVDSFRIYEALECGCIPIVEKISFDYFEKLFGKSYPFPSIDNWNQAPELINRLVSDPRQLEQLRQECYTWWSEYKKEMKRNIADIIENTFY